MGKEPAKLLRVGKAAQELGVHPVTVRRWIKAGRVQALWVGREMRLARSELDRLKGVHEARLLVLYGRVSGHGQQEDLTRATRASEPVGGGGASRSGDRDALRHWEWMAPRASFVTTTAHLGG